MVISLAGGNFRRGCCCYKQQRKGRRQEVEARGRGKGRNEALIDGRHTSNTEALAEGSGKAS